MLNCLAASLKLAVSATRTNSSTSLVIIETTCPCSLFPLLALLRDSRQWITFTGSMGSDVLIHCRGISGFRGTPFPSFIIAARVDAAAEMDSQNPTGREQGMSDLKVEERHAR